MNETRCVQFPVDLQHELTVKARALLNDRNRLDLVLWDEVLNVTCPTKDCDMTKDTAVQSTIERHTQPRAASAATI